MSLLLCLFVISERTFRNQKCIKLFEEGIDWSEYKSMRFTWGMSELKLFLHEKREIKEKHVLLAWKKGNKKMTSHGNLFVQFLKVIHHILNAISIFCIICYMNQTTQMKELSQSHRLISQDWGKYKYKLTISSLSHFLIFFTSKPLVAQAWSSWENTWVRQDELSTPLWKFLLHKENKPAKF